MKKLLLLCITVIYADIALAQKPVVIDGRVNQHKFTLGEIAVLEDSTGKLNFKEIATSQQARFKPNSLFYPNNKNNSSVYWFRVTVDYRQSRDKGNQVIEFFDQTTDDVTAYLPDVNGRYVESRAGAGYSFDGRLFRHKNFEFMIRDTARGAYTYYFRVKSYNLVNVIIVYRTVDYFIHYALNEYLTYGIFYGMVLIFCFHNLLMFLAVKRRQYLYYVFYVLSVGLYEMSVDGIAFQYLWPAYPQFNHYSVGIALYLMGVFALIFTKELLQIRIRAPFLGKLINYVIVARTAYFVYCLLFAKWLFVYKFVEAIPLSMAFACGIYIYRNGFKPARFFVLAYAILSVGFVIKVISALGYAYFLPAPVSYYSLSFCFVMEMVLLSFAIGDQVRILRKEKDAAHEETVRQMELNSELQAGINQELERQVAIRTKEVVEKSNEILAKNEQLAEQAAEISRMNVLLEKDNVQLKTNIEKVTESRALSAELDFDEFSAKYPDQETCFKFLAGLKWKNGYSCGRCANATYCGGRLPHSRRCTKCSYEESAIYNTIFENSRIPINKAFYITYLMYTSKGTISSHQLAEKLSIRQSTCWTYSLRIKKVMADKKRMRKTGDQGWSTLVI